MMIELGQGRLQVVPADVAGVGAVRAVVVVPILGRQNARNAQTDDRSRDRSGRSLPFGQPCDQIPEGHHAQSDPDREGIKRAGIDVVAFTGLVGRGVEVDHQRDTHHDEEPHDDREVARVAVELIDQTDQPQDEGEEIVGVPRLVAGHFVRQILLRSEVLLVDPPDAREPVAVGDEGIGGLNVVLTSYEVPEEVAPVHVVELVGEEVVQVLECRRFDDYRRSVPRTVVPDRLAAEVEHLGTLGAPLVVADDLSVLVAHIVEFGAVGAPGLVGLFRSGVIPHAREEVHELRRIFVAVDDTALLVFPVLVQIAGRFVFVVDDRCGELRSVEERLVTVLIAVEHREEGERIVRIVAVHRRVDRGADRHGGIGGVSDQNHQCREQHGVQHHAPLLVALVDAEPEGGQQGQGKDDHTELTGRPSVLTKNRSTKAPM